MPTHPLRFASALFPFLAVSIALAAALPESLPALRDVAARHNIFIGSAVDPAFFSEPAYSSILARDFSLIEPENAMKFESIHPRPGSAPSSFDFGPADSIVSFAQSHKLKVRGHCLVWHQQIPDWLVAAAKNGSVNSDALRQILQQHIAVVAGRYSGKLYAWDVVNEAFNDDGSLRSTLWFNSPGILPPNGPAYIEQALVWAHAADPHVKLFYNDYGAEPINAKSDAIFAMARDFRNRHVPLDGIGFQLHVNLGFDNPTNLRSFSENLDRFAKLGLELHFTELDIALDSPSPENLARQADLYGKIAAICVRNPSCKLFQTWGFTDKHSWIPEFSKGKQGYALPWDSDFRPKPAFSAILSAFEHP